MKEEFRRIAGADGDLVAGEPAGSEIDGPSVATAVSAADRRVRALDLKRTISELQSELERTREELVSLLNRGPFDLAYAVVEGTPVNARVQLRGDRDSLGQEVPRGFLKVLGGDALGAGDAGSGRLELAGWLTRRENPLTARVMVNRIWQYHFGRGLVQTPNDFGYRGRKPTHPELLDHLATRFIEAGWSIKALHRLLMNSAAYQQASRTAVDGEQAREMGAGISAEFVAAGMENDPVNDYYWRFNRRRLDAEPLRDSILFVAGELDLTPGEGHPFPSPTSWGYTQHAPFKASYDHHRRSIYLMTQRLQRHPFLSLFDGADPNASTPSRNVSTVPTQALYFMNDPFVHQNAERFAARLFEAPGTDGDRIEFAWRLALGRSPGAIERADAAAFLTAYRAELGSGDHSLAESKSWAALARSLFASNEFLHVD